MDEASVPVIVGVGEAVDRVSDALAAQAPLALVHQAIAAARADTGAARALPLDRLEIINIASYGGEALAGPLADALGIARCRTAYGPVGGETPVAALHHAAQRIAAGEAGGVLVCGVEVQYSVSRALRTGEYPEWFDAKAIPEPGVRGADVVHPLALACGLASPAHVYPLFEVATSGAWGQTIGEAMQETAGHYARFNAVACANPHAWRAAPLSGEAIVTPSHGNRLVAWPYPVRVVANPLVNQAAAVIVTSLAAAREAGMAEGRIVHFAGGAHACEPRDFMARDGFAASPAQGAVLDAVGGFAPTGFAALELYSCFPCVPKMARRVLRLPESSELTVTGGLSFFGAPLSAYMLHAAAAMVARIRAGAQTGLLYGQGEFLTKHHALVLRRTRPEAPLAREACVQAEADGRRGPVPATIACAQGPARVEAATVLYRKDGSIRHGAVVVRLPSGARSVAIVPPQDTGSLDALVNPAGVPVGLLGDLVAGPDNQPARWRVT